MWRVVERIVHSVFAVCLMSVLICWCCCLAKLRSSSAMYCALLSPLLQISYCIFSALLVSIRHYYCFRSGVAAILNIPTTGMYTTTWACASESLCAERHGRAAAGCRDSPTTKDTVYYKPMKCAWQTTPKISPKMRPQLQATQDYIISPYVEPLSDICQQIQQGCSLGLQRLGLVIYDTIGEFNVDW